MPGRRSTEDKLKASARQAGPQLDTGLVEIPGEATQIRLYLIYRVALGVSLLLAYFLIGRGPLGTYQPALFVVAVHLYVGLAIAALILYLRWTHDEEKQAQLAIFIDIVLIALLATGLAHAQPAAGPLRVSYDNPRYFADPKERIVYLTGSHTWDNLQDMGEVCACAFV